MNLKIFLNYLSATILGLAAVNLANFADASIVGNVVGAEGLADISLCQPLMQAVFSIYSLFVLSSSILTGMAIGAGDRAKASRLLAFGMKATIIIGLVICVAGYVFFDQLSQFLCKSEVLRPYTNAYLRIILLAILPQMGMYALNQYVTVDGSPRFVSCIAVMGGILNVCLDIIFIKFMGWGTSGAALATLIMYTTSVLLLLRHRFTGVDGVLQSIKKGCDGLRHLGEVVGFGIPLFLSTSLLAVHFYCNNIVVTTLLGTDHMVVMAVCMQLYGFSLVILVGSQNTVQPLGARLMGAHDRVGMLLMYRYAFAFLLMSTLTFSGLIALLPITIAKILGVNSAHQLGIAATALPAYAAYLILLPMIFVLQSAYQFYKRSTLTYVHSFGVTLLPPGCFALYAFTDADNCWWGFVLGLILILVILFVISEMIRRNRRSLVPLLLIERE